MNFEKFCTYMETFLTHIKTEKNLSSHTYRAYEGDLRQLISFWDTIQQRESNNYTLSSILERYFAMLYHKKIDSSSIARKISCLNSYEKFLNKQYALQLDLQLTRPRVAQKLPTSLPIHTILEMLDTVPLEKIPTQFPLRDIAIFELFSATGIRCSELVALKIKDTNILEKKIIIHGKNNRVISFGASCEKKLLRYLSHERPAIKHPSEYLFLNYRHEPLTTRSIQRIFTMFRDWLQIDHPLTPHIVRHSFATHLVHQGTDVKQVQELLGHKTIASAEKYTHKAHTTENTP